MSDINWSPAVTFKGGICKTDQRYLDSQNWIMNVTGGVCRDQAGEHYGAT